ncbi:endophilin-B1 isoform X2 [Lethenteron reissneri]|uniref:endophilin-B1 isoform X2 n=1 Tax=Lethenteron reissneri TaxID=7753 RepID=UPI002AB79F97|nr:endophilin-B1 isoform X2 [Lethenteron reissneri]
MDFNMKKLASDAGTFFTRAVQFTEEKLGGAERTELDAHFENLMTRADSTKNWTEKIMRQTEVVLQPNPTARVEEFVYEKLEKKGPARQRTVELLGQYMTDAGNDFGAGTPYGGALIKVGESQKLLGLAEKEFVQASTINFLTPLRNFLEGDYKAMAKERKLLQNKRLDLDASKTRLRKAKAAEARASDEPDIRETRPRNVVFWASMAGMWTKEVSKGEQEVRVAQAEFDRQAEITRLLLEGISTTHANHLRCLNEFVEAQMTYYAQCYQYMVDLQKQMGSFPTTFLPNSSAPLPPVTVPIPAAPPGASELTAAELQPASGTRRARVLYDYDAGDSSELSLLADEMITVYSVPGLGSDWLMSERGTQKGKVPVAYLELLK